MPVSGPIGKRFRLERLWRNELSWYEWPLWASVAPLSAVYAAGLALRRTLWRRMHRRAGVLTISVGNLTVGGNGKTPFAVFLANRLAACGLRPAIVSRGYGRQRARASQAALVSVRGELRLSPEEAGDEPAMIARSFDGPVVVARRRLRGIELLSRLGPVDAVILDDAFQHTRLARDVDLLLVSAERGFGNGWLLPAGPMRERLGAARRASAIILVSSEAGATDALTPGQQRVLAGIRTFRATLRPRALVYPERGQWREAPPALAGRRVLAVSGLADPRGFYGMLRALDADLVGVLEYPDHHRYTTRDWQAIGTAASGLADVVVTTEKDLVKLEKFPFPRDSLCALRLEVVMGVPQEERLLALVTASLEQPQAAAES